MSNMRMTIYIAALGCGWLTYGRNSGENNEWEKERLECFESIISDTIVIQAFKSTFEQTSLDKSKPILKNLHIWIELRLLV